MPVWDADRTDGFEKDVKRVVKKDGSLRSRLEKKLKKILEDPERVGVPKTGRLAGHRSERVGHHVIIFRVHKDDEDNPERVEFLGFWHHNDPRYDP